MATVRVFALTHLSLCYGTLPIGHP